MSYPTLEDVIGKTPLIRLQRIPGADNDARGNVILAKLEGNNPAGSVKDRPAISMIRRAEERGDIKPGDTLIVSGSWAGTTWVVDGTPENPITIRGEGATFTGPLTLNGSTWLKVEGFKFEKATNQVALLDSHFITLRGTVFDYVTRGILIQEYSSHLLIEGNEFYQTCAAGKTWTQLKGSNCEGGACQTSAVHCLGSVENQGSKASAEAASMRPAPKAVSRCGGPRSTADFSIVWRSFTTLRSACAEISKAARPEA